MPRTAGTTATETTKATTKAKRRRQKAKLLPPLPKPKPQPAYVSTPLLAEGRLAVSVTLEGINGEGDFMILDEAQWPRIKLAFGEHWGVLVARGHRYVVAHGRQSGMKLARWLAGARPGQVVRHVNGDNLDLRKANLVVVDREEFIAGVFGHLDDSEAVMVA